MTYTGLTEEQKAGYRRVQQRNNVQSALVAATVLADIGLGAAFSYSAMQITQTHVAAIGGVVVSSIAWKPLSSLGMKMYTRLTGYEP